MSGNDKTKPGEAWGDDLTAKQRAFCQEYLVDLNATQAAIRAGYSEDTARSQGQRLLTNVDIQCEVQQLMDKRAGKVEVSAERVLSELCALAFYDPADLAGVEITCPKDIAKLPEKVRRCIIGWGWDKAGNFTLKLAAKTQQLDLIGRHLKMFTDKMEHSGPNGGAILMEGRSEADMEKFAEMMAAARGKIEGGE